MTSTPVLDAIERDAMAHKDAEESMAPECLTLVHEVRELRAERDEYKRQAALYHADMMRVRAQRDDARRAALLEAAEMLKQEAFEHARWSGSDTWKAAETKVRALLDDAGRGT